MNITLAKILKEKPTDESCLGFGEIFTDHMFIMNYTVKEGWHNPRIEPYAPITLSPAAACLHYSQEVFEGMKAYRSVDNDIQLFRPSENFKRLNESNKRLCIPEIDEDFALEALKKLVEIEKDWVPSIENASLYIRPFIIATQEKLGVQASKEYLFIIILSPSGPYYKSGLNPVKIYVEPEYARAVKGGTGTVKTGGNYAASLIAQVEAHDQGYSQVLWLDGSEKKYIEEVGAMNVFFVIGDEVITPELSGSILPGITRKSAIEIMQNWGMKVCQRRISLEEIIENFDKGLIKEVFGTGTAAVVSPVGELKCGKKIMIFNDNKIGEISQRLYDELTGIQWGSLEDKNNWIVKI